MMDTSKLEAKLRTNGIEMINEGGQILFKSKKVNILKYIITASLFIPALLIFIIVPLPWYIAVAVLGAGISCLYHGIKSLMEAMKFNKADFKILDSKLVINSEKIGFSEAGKFRAKLATNPLFPNIPILIKHGKEDLEVFRIHNSKKKYLNEDKYVILSELNALSSHTQK